MCTGVQCCIENDVIQRTIEFSLLLDPCTNRLSISIEKARYNRTLGDFEYGMCLISVKKKVDMMYYLHRKTCPSDRTSIYIWFGLELTEKAMLKEN